MENVLVSRFARGIASVPRNLRALCPHLRRCEKAQGQRGRAALVARGHDMRGVVLRELFELLPECRGVYEIGYERSYRIKPFGLVPKIRRIHELFDDADAILCAPAPMHVCCGSRGNSRDKCFCDGFHLICLLFVLVCCFYFTMKGESLKGGTAC